MSAIANDFIDFYYCGHTLSEYNGFIGDINGGGVGDPVEIGSVLSLNPVELKPLKKRKSVYATYDDYVEKQFSFFKKPCGGLSYYSRGEVAEIIRWLNQPKYERFVPMYTYTAWTVVHYYATFNVHPIIYQGNVIGFQLNMSTNAPFGYYEEVSVSGESILELEDTSDEQGFIYPTCTIEVSHNGHVILTNNREPDNRTVVSNCVSGETITLNGETGTIASSGLHPNLCDDFNYVFPKIWNKMESDGTNHRLNIFSTNRSNTNITITYEPISKFGLI